MSFKNTKKLQRGNISSLRNSQSITKYCITKHKTHLEMMLSKSAMQLLVLLFIKLNFSSWTPNVRCANMDWNKVIHKSCHVIWKELFLWSARVNTKYNFVCLYIWLLNTPKRTPVSFSLGTWINYVFSCKKKSWQMDLTFRCSWKVSENRRKVSWVDVSTA